MAREVTPATLEDVLARLEASLDDLTGPTCGAIYAELDSYAHASITPEALGAAVGRNLRTTLTALRDGTVPAAESLDGAAQTARERYEAGVPVEEIVRGFRISIALIHERFVDLAVSLRLPAPAFLSGIRIIWTVADRFTTRIITEYHSLEVDAALRDNEQRLRSVRAVLAGEIPDEHLLDVVTRAVPYAAVHADIPAGAEGSALRALLERTGSTPGARAIVVTDGSTCFGLVAARPDEPDIAVGIGPFLPLEQAARSGRIARESCRLARRLRRTGLQGAGELGWRLAAAERPEVTEIYDQRFLEPLRAEGVFGREIRAAVRAWLENGQSIPRAAEELTVHVNTIRYRLQRFQELCGVDHLSTDDLVGLAWALEFDNRR